MMTLKEIARKIWDIALKVSEFSCSCGCERGQRRVYGNPADLHTTEPGNEREDYESKQVMT
ncbi:MAG: hypothetical protein AAGB97_06880 [Dehalococcoidia bacterium]|nr:hypothetical protein [Chloroflexota bacterium]